MNDASGAISTTAALPCERALNHFSPPVPELDLPAIPFSRDAPGLSPPYDYVYNVTVDVATMPLIAAVPPLSNSEYAQVFNPTWVQATSNTQNRSGLLIRSQNCTAAPGKGCVHCSGTGQHASWLTWVQLLNDDGAAPKANVHSPASVG